MVRQHGAAPVREKVVWASSKVQRSANARDIRSSTMEERFIMTRLSYGIIAVSFGGAAILAACGGTSKTPAGDTTASARHQAGSLEGASAVPASGTAVPLTVSPSATPSATQDALEANMRAMMGASGDQLRAMVPQHGQLVTTMIAQMNQEMGSTNMPASAAWMATRDSVSRDLMRLPNMSARDIQAMLPAHQARVSRLMQMHQGMMGSMMPNR